MKYSNEIQTEAIERAAKRLNLDTHITYCEYQKDLYNWADRLMKMWYRKGMPYKRSFLMCDSLDVNFFFMKEGEAAYTYAGYADNRDAQEEKIVEAFRIANKMREYMQEEAEKLIQEVQP
jgi:hypothetical protein